MLIQADRLKRSPRRIEINEQAEEFPAIKELLENGEITFEAPITGTLIASRSGKIVEVKGLLETRVCSACCRCLDPVIDSLSIDVTLCYTQCDEKGDVAQEEEVELTDDDLGLIPFDGHEIDLRHDVAQELIMALPLQQLCSESCQGLCPVCGGNLNQTKCGCEQPIFHSGLAALKNLKIEQK